MDDYLEIVRSVKPKPNAARRSYQPLNSQQPTPENVNNPQRGSLNPGVPNPSRPSTTLINQIPKQGLDQFPVTYSVPYSASPQNIAPSSMNYLHEGFPAITTTTSQFIPRSTQSFYQSSYNNLAPPVSEMHASNFNQFSHLSQRNRVSPQQESRRKTSIRENERKEKEYNKTTKKLRRKRNSNKGMVFLGSVIFLAILALLGYKHFLNPKESSVVFCTADLNEMNDMDDCTFCPPNGRCYEGKLEGCKEGYEIYKDECVSKRSLEAKKKIDQYLNFIDDKLAELKGDTKCYSELRPKMTEHQVKETLDKEFKDDGYFRKNKAWVLSRIEEIVEREEHPHLKMISNKYSTNRTGEPSALCRMRLVWMDKESFRIVLLVLLWILLLVLSVQYGTRYIMKKREYKRLAGELYSEILAYLYHWEKVRVKQLKKDFEEWAQGYNYRRLWNGVEELKKKDCKVYSYLDYFQNNVEEFWMLPK